MSIKLPGCSANAPDLKPTRHTKPPQPPTIHQLAEAIYRYCRELGLDDEFATKIFDFAVGSVHTAWSVVDFSITAVRSVQANRKLKGDRTEYVKEFEAYLEQKRQADLKATAEEKKDGNLLLRGLPQGRPLRLGDKALKVVLAWTIPAFDAPKGTLFAQEDIPRLVYRNQRFAVWMLENALTGENLEAFKAEFEAACEEDRRAEAAAIAAGAATPETEESDEDVAVEESAEQAG